VITAVYRGKLHGTILKIFWFKLKKMQASEIIEREVKEYFEGTDGFLVNIKSGNGKKIQVFVDRMGKNIAVDDCVALSRKIEAVLDESGLVSENYNLEVSSPGMDNAFNVFEQFEKNTGRNVVVLMLDGIKIEGVLKNHSRESFTIEEHRVIKKKQAPEIIEHTLKYDEVKSVKKKINFK